MTEPRGPRRPGPDFDTGQVRRHYARLAPAYAEGANASCADAYADLARRAFARCERVVEVGAGSGALLGELGRAGRLACDLSLPMLAAGGAARRGSALVADGQELPVRDGVFDGFLAINVLEHLPEPARLVREAARVLSPGGRFLAVTPNGDLERLLGLLERLRLKLPEGPHRFLGFDELSRLADRSFRILEHRRFLALPAGPPALVRAIDRWVSGRSGRGLFQFLLLEKRGGETR